MRSIIWPVAVGGLLGGAEGAIAAATWWVFAGPGRRRRTLIGDAAEVAGLAAVAYAVTRPRPQFTPAPLGRWP
jgi:hypothetical protein